MLMNGMLIPPANIGDELEPGEPGYHAPALKIFYDYLTEDQSDTLREAARVESCSGQQLTLLDAVNRMNAAGGQISRDFFEMSAKGYIISARIESSMRELEAASAKLLVTMQEIIFQIGESDRDVIAHILHDVSFQISNKRRALDWERKANPAPTHNKEER